MFQKFEHEIQIAHRLSTTFPGSKCENIHGHSLKVQIALHGNYDDGVIVNMEQEPLEFGWVKKKFRGYLDENFDHRLLLNREDPWAQPVFQLKRVQQGMQTLTSLQEDNEQVFLPGLQLIDGDPTTENLARLLALHFAEEFKVTVCEVYIQETASNGVGVAVWWNVDEYELAGA